jgi:dUTP pyrophosphatase
MPVMDGDAGADLRACIGVSRELSPGQRWSVGTGVAVAIPSGFVGLVLPRSGLARNHGVVAAVGVIDSGYRGELGVTLINHGQQSYSVVPGERIAQLVILPVAIAEFVDVERLPDSARGTSGFGSTGR